MHFRHRACKWLNIFLFFSPRGSTERIPGILPCLRQCWRRTEMEAREAKRIQVCVKQGRTTATHTFYKPPTLNSRCNYRILIHKWGKALSHSNSDGVDFSNRMASVWLRKEDAVQREGRVGTKQLHNIGIMHNGWPTFIEQLLHIHLL